MVTSIQLDNKTKARLEKMKSFPKESYDDVVNRLLNVANDDEGVLSKQTIKNIEQGIADIKAGRVYTSEQVKKRLGLK
jgi:predicted transcriptional regulator